jgi:REP-associated tyrosine transposase
MSRPRRIEYAGALYHVTSRGDRKEAIYEDDFDRKRFLEILGDVVSRFNWVCHAYCLMGNHYHLLIETPDGNLSKGMRQLNGVYTQVSNRRHERVGHLFQGRYKAILVDANAYFLELNRYVVLNPVRASLVDHPGDWLWSSYRAVVGIAPAPDWLTTDRLLSQFSNDRQQAIHRYDKFASRGVGRESVWRHLNRQIYLGDDSFVTNFLEAEDKQPLVDGIPKVQQRAAAPALEQFALMYPARNEAIVAAYDTGQYSYQQIARHYGLHFSAVGKIVRRARSD